MNSAIRSLLIAIGIFLFLTLTGAFYVVSETQQVIITQFGKPIGDPIKTAGVKFKIPFIQTVNVIDKRVLPWDGPPAEMPTKDKLYINVDAFGRWRISDPLIYFQRFREMHSALSRLDDILGSEMRNTIARHELVEVVRTTKGRKVQVEALGSGASGAGLPAIQRGRVALEEEVYEAAKEKLAEFGIELLDVRFMRINYNAAVASKIYDRMVSERRQIAERFRSEGAGEAAKIIGQKERELRQIESEAYRQTQVLMGKADAEATAIYAEAYNGSPEAREFYEFTRAIEMYKSSFSKDTSAILTTDSSLLRFFKGAGTSQVGPGAASAPASQRSPAVSTSTRPEAPKKPAMEAATPIEAAAPSTPATPAPARAPSTPVPLQ